MAKNYERHIHLTAAQRDILISNMSWTRASEMRYTNILLDLDDGLSFNQVKIKRNTSFETITKVIGLYKEFGVEGMKKKRVHAAVILTKEIIDKIVEISTSQHPGGKKRWSDKDIAEYMVKNGICKRISEKSVCVALYSKRNWRKDKEQFSDDYIRRYNNRGGKNGK